MRRNDHPSRPNAMTCSRFSLLKTWLMTKEAKCPRSGSVLSLPAMAGFHLIIDGRFWVIAEGAASPATRKLGGESSVSSTIRTLTSPPAQQHQRSGRGRIGRVSAGAKIDRIKGKGSIGFTHLSSSD